MFLSYLIFGPIVGAVIVYIAGFVNVKTSKILTVIITGAIVAATLYLLLGFNGSISGFQLVENYDWVKDFGLSYIVGVDGISLPLLIITSVLTALSAVYSWNQITTNVKEYNALLLLFEGAIVGVFTSLNLIVFYIFWELVLIPMFLLIGIWGGPHRKYAAMKFLLMTHVGGVLILLSFISLYVLSTPHTFNFTNLINIRLVMPLQVMISIGFFVGFGVKLPIVPLHTWLPPAYVEAPTPISVLLAGLVGSMGAYGFIRMNLFLLPEASRFLAPIFIGFGVLTMFYGAFAALTQQDLKRLISFTSVSHMGYVLLGAFTLTEFGVSGAVFQMFNHALVIGALFIACGVIQERMGTRTIGELLGLGNAMPKVSFVLVLASLAALGLPGFGNFVSEYSVLLAGISVNTYYAIAVLVPGITAGYFMWTLRRVLRPAPTKPVVRNEAPWYTFLSLAILIVPLLLLGLYPTPLLENVIIPAVQSLVH